LQGLGNVQLALEIGRIFDILRRHRIQARAHMTMVNLALATAEGLGKRLAPDLSLATEALPYLAEALGVPVPEAAQRV
jgi:predicted unusual protein kinase regulating ubiquinone biosynthesis (AarF/ABC1/UbiB family)